MSWDCNVGYVRMRAMATPVSEKKGRLTLWKISRLIILCGMVVVIFLMLKRPPAVADAVVPEVAKQHSDDVQAKLAELELAHQRGEAAEARFSSEEINSALQKAQAEPPEAPAAAHPQPSAVTSPEQRATSPEPAPEINTTLVAFEGDHATGQFLVHALGGKDIYLTVSGKIKAVNGYASFEFTEGKIGEMPVPITLLNSQLQAKLQDPETRAKLKLPDFVADIRVENGQLVIREK
jgi:hypothetical protein